MPFRGRWGVGIPVVRGREITGNESKRTPAQTDVQVPGSRAAGIAPPITSTPTVIPAQAGIHASR
jgi:hypothetical protein